jgi:hypothetical protein
MLKKSKRERERENKSQKMQVMISSLTVNIIMVHSNQLQFISGQIKLLWMDTEQFRG